MKVNFDVTDAEREVLNVLWDKQYASNYDITSTFEKSHNWSRHTVKTYLNRLMEKGLVGLNALSERRYRYYPTMTREEFLAGETKIYINSRYSGLTHMLAGLVQSHEITETDLQELEDFIKSHRSKENGHE